MNNGNKVGKTSLKEDVQGFAICYTKWNKIKWNKGAVNKQKKNNNNNHLKAKSSVSLSLELFSSNTWTVQ